MTDESKTELPEELPLSPVAERLKALGLPVRQVPRDKNVKVRIRLRPPAREKEQ